MRREVLEVDWDKVELNESAGGGAISRNRNKDVLLNYSKKIVKSWGYC